MVGRCGLVGLGVSIEKWKIDNPTEAILLGRYEFETLSEIDPQSREGLSYHLGGIGDGQNQISRFSIKTLVSSLSCPSVKNFAMGA